MGSERRTRHRSAYLAASATVLAGMTALPALPAQAAQAATAPDVVIAQPVAISPDGTVLARFILSDGGNLGGVWGRDGKLTYLPEPAGASGENVLGINARDQVAGTVFYPGGRSSAAEWSRDGKITILPGGARALGGGNNDCGEIVGYDGDSTTSWPAAWSRTGAETRLALPANSPFGQATAVNDTGTVVGQAYVTGKAFEPTLWRPDGQLVPLATPGEFDSGAVNGINASGHSVGDVAVALPSAPEDPVRWDADGNATVLGGGEGDAWAINDEGVAVGILNGGTSLDGAVEWGPDAVPTALPVPPGTYSSLSEAYGINDAGDIVGTVETNGSDTAIVVWTPSGKIIDLATYPPIG